MTNNKSLDNFKINTYEHKCSVCGKQIDKYFAVSIKSTDPRIINNISNKPCINIYKFTFCEKHYLEFEEMLKNLISTDEIIKKQIDDIIEKDIFD